MEYQKVIQSEVNYLREYNLDTTDIWETVIALRATTSQAMTAYSTVGATHGMQLLRQVGGYIKCYAEANSISMPIRVNQARVVSSARDLLMVDQWVLECVKASLRGAVGEVHEMFNTILNTVASCIDANDVPQRQGFEVS